MFETALTALKTPAYWEYLSNVTPERASEPPPLIKFTQKSGGPPLF